MQASLKLLALLSSMNVVELRAWRKEIIKRDLIDNRVSTLLSEIDNAIENKLENLLDEISEF